MTEVAALASIAKAALQTFSSLAKDELLLLWNSQKELKKLEDTINTLTNIAYDADADGRETKGRTVKDFLSRMRNAMYDAEDLFDGLTAQAIRKRTTGGNKFTKEEAEWVNDVPWNSLSSSLHSLELYKIKGMEQLPDGVQHLTSLQSLSIYRCRELRSLPDWISNLTSLRKLGIENCSEELKNRCKGGGEDWSLIQHIRYKYISTGLGSSDEEKEEEEGSRKMGGCGGLSLSKFKSIFH